MLILFAFPWASGTETTIDATAGDIIDAGDDILMAEVAFGRHGMGSE